MKQSYDLRYDRRVDATFLAHFEPGGVFASVVEYARSGLFPLDVQLRSDPKTGRDHLTLYVGLTAVLQVHGAKDGRLRLAAHATHQKNGGFDKVWTKALETEEWGDLVPEVELYLERVIPQATRSHGLTEGAVQTAVARADSSLVVLDREVTPSFRDAATKTQILQGCSAPVLEALDAADLGIPGRPKKLGTECDLLALDRDGRVLAIEVKPSNGAGIAWAPAQALMYARVLQRWIDEDVPQAATVLSETAQQRQALRSGPSATVPVPSARVTPVVALQRGASDEMVRRMRRVRDALRDSPTPFPEVELYEVSLTGRLLRLDESRTATGRPRSVAHSYAASHDAAGVRWKATLPEPARAPGARKNRSGELVDRDVLLPDEHADLNLLPEVREQALELFADLDIPWHQGHDGHPSTHLRSSQVQCVNALGQMVHDADRIKAAFGGVLDIAEVRDLGQISPDDAGRHLTFELISPTDYLSEGRLGRPRTRGSQCTSVDAAFAYRTSAGVDELALVEWKFTEAYRSATPSSARTLKKRTDRYAALIADPASPIDAQEIETADLFHEPVYQLVRQQLLAWQLEADADVPARVVRVVHVLSPDNLAYERSYRAPTVAALGEDITGSWLRLLRRPDRFVKLDPAVFLDPAVTSPGYVARYSL